jgi:hypothetical protein
MYNVVMKQGANLFSLINPNIHISKGVLGLILLLFLVVYGSISSVLFYHWRRYGMHSASVVFAELVFLLVSALFIYMAIIGIAVY